MEATGQTATATLDTPQHTAAGAARPHLVLVLNSAAPMETSVRFPLGELHEVTVGRGPARQFTPEKRGSRRCLHIELPDHLISSKHARLTCTDGTWTCEDLDSKNGTVLDGARITRSTLTHGSLLEMGRSLFRFSVAPCENDAIVADETLKAPVPELVTFNQRLASTFAAMAEIAKRDVKVLVLGPTGTGKELVARALHQLSGRPGDLVAVNLSAISDSLLGTELFGCRRGAYSGADEDRLGLVRAADGGTLFLDEFGDLSPGAQTALLRVLQERVVIPLGTTKALPVDIRLVGATHRDLHELVETGGFREDLLARLSGFVVRLPTLQERKDDLGLLIRAIVRTMPERPKKPEFTQVAARALLRYHWPLNVRELESTLKAAFALVGERPVDLRHLPEPVQEALTKAPPELESSPEQSGGPPISKDRLVTLLREQKGIVADVAKILRKHRAQIYRWIKTYEIDITSF